MSVVIAAGLGVGLGVVTGMPLGVINVAILEAASAGRRRFAIGLGAGGGIADAGHAALAFGGVGRLVTARPAVVQTLAIAAAAAIVIYAVRAWKQRPRAKAEAAPGPTSLARGIATGGVLTLPNVGALAAWVAVAASVWPDAELVEAAAIAIGVGLGSALWFTLLARWISRVHQTRPDHRAFAIVPRLALALLVAIAIAGVARAFFC